MNLKVKNNSFSPKGFRVFLKRDLPTMTLIMVIFIALFFLFCKQTFLVAPAAKQIAWANREVAMIHGFVISLFAFLYLIGKISDDRWHFMLNITRGFLLADLFMILCYPEVSSQLKFDITHHVCLFIGLFFAAQVLRKVAWVLVVEITVVPVYFCWYLVKCHRNGEPIFIVMSAITLVVYFIRVSIFTWVFTKIWQEYRAEKSKEKLARVFLGAPLALLNYMWFYKLLQKGYELLL